MTFLLVLRALRLFPADVSPLICSFVGWTRSDWRTCKREESDLIARFNHWTKRVLNNEARDWSPGVKMNFPILFHQNELEYYLEEWTLLGRWSIILFTRDHDFWFRSRKLWVVPRDDYLRWYRMDFLWRHHERRLS